MSRITTDPEYTATAALDALRAADYGRLDAGGQVYLDYTGSGLYAASQVRAHTELLASQVLGNPHSVGGASAAATSLVEGARQSVLRFFNADPAVYTAVFTANASGAIKLVAESFPFAPPGQLLLAADNHNSINGAREFAIGRGATVAYAPLTVPGPADHAEHAGHRRRAAAVCLSGAVELLGGEASAHARH